MSAIHDVREDMTTFRVFVCNMIARERAEVGLSVVEKLRPWIKTREMALTAQSENEAWEKAFDLYPPAEGYFVESVQPVKKAD